MDPLWKQYKRIVKPTGAIALFGTLRFGTELIFSNPKMFRYHWVWEKSRRCGFLDANRRPLRIHEFIFIFGQKNPLYYPQKTIGKPYTRKASDSFETEIYHNTTKKTKTVNKGERFPVDIMRFENSSQKTLHPTQKPVPLLEYMIKTYTLEGETVLDNTMGSGSTGVACVQTGRRFIGIEMNDTYFQIARNRIQEEDEVYHIESEREDSFLAVA